MSFVAGREPTNWEWFVDPVDHIISSVILGGVNDDVINDVRVFCAYMEDNWLRWGILFGSFLTTSIASFDEDERDEMRNYVMGLASRDGGVDAALFDTLAAMEWMFTDPNASVELRPLPTEEPVLFFVSVFCMLAGLFHMVRLPAGVTPSSTLVSVFVRTLNELGASQQDNLSR